jgi:tetratricopeptide (TPR) repeat protein
MSTAPSPTGHRSSPWLALAFWKVSRIVLVLATLAGLLTAAVFLVLAMIAVGEGNSSLLVRGLLGGLVSLCLTWLLGRGARGARNRANDIAIAEHAAALRLEPLDPVAHCNQGFACVRRGEYARAIAHYEAALRLDPKDPYPYLGRVNAYGSIGQFDRVIAEYTEVIRLDPGNALAYCARGTACNATGRFDLAIADAGEAIRLDPNLYLGYDVRGYGLWHKGNFNVVLKVLAIAWMLGTFGFLRRDHFDWRTPTGSKADHEQAVADFTEAIRLNPKAWDSYQGRALVQRALGEHARAAADEARVREALR